VRLTWLGHATMVLDLDGTRLLVDPLLRRFAGPLRRRGPMPRPEQWADTDAVLVSHLHHDHADLPSLRLVGEVPTLSGEGNAAYLRGRGFNGVGLNDGWHPVGSNGVSVRLVRADHHSRPMPHRPNEAYGHLVRGPSATVWVAGDTSLYPELTEIPSLAGGQVDLAIVPIGGWGPRLSRGHLDPDAAARACALVGARDAMPYHWGSLYMPGTRLLPGGWLDLPGALFPGAMKRHAPDSRTVMMHPGETVDL